MLSFIATLSNLTRQIAINIIFHFACQSLLSNASYFIYDFFILKQRKKFLSHFPLDWHYMRINALNCVWKIKLSLKQNWHEPNNTGIYMLYPVFALSTASLEANLNPWLWPTYQLPWQNVPFWELNRMKFVIHFNSSSFIIQH